MSLMRSPSSFPVVIRCTCCDRRLLRSELMSYAGWSRSAMNGALVVVISVCVSMM